MRITVALTPRLLREPRRHAIAVIDLLRATTSIVTMFDNGLIRAIATENIQQARRMARGNFSLLCGEIRAQQPAGFDYGNSPAEFAGLSFRGKSAVVMTTNGTRALAAVADAPFAVAGAMLNRAAVARRLVAEAGERGIDIAAVCAGTERGTAFSLEDTAGAGALVEAAVQTEPALHLSDEAWAALHIWRWYRRDPMRAFRQSRHGRALAGLGFDADLQCAARTDISSSVPVIYVENGIPVLRLRASRGARSSRRSPG
jgi:2-phosphosulfolactate phosphatase